MASSSDWGFLSAAVADGSLWLGSPNGLVRIDPHSGVATLVDTEPGANIAASTGQLWRSAFDFDLIKRYDLRSGRRPSDLTITGPLGIFAMRGAFWVAGHTTGAVLKLDPSSGRVLHTTAVTTPECCGTGGFARLDDRLFASITKDNAIVELDPASARVVGKHPVDQACDGLAAAGGVLWTCAYTSTSEVDLDQFESVRRVDPATFESRVIDVGPHSGLPGEIDGQAWIPVGDALVALGKNTGEPVRAVRFDLDGYNASYVLQALGYVWVYSRHDSRVIRIDPAALR